MRMSRVLSLLLTLALLAGMLASCGAQAQTQRELLPRDTSVSLWYVRGGVFAAELERLVDEYNRTEPSAYVSLRGFDSEELLGEALNSGRPDLLLCTHERAFGLYEQDRLKSLTNIEDAPDYTGDFAAASESVGTAFFPLGAELPLLAVKGSYEGKLATVEALCAAASAYARETGRAFFTTESYAELFASCLEQRDCPFYAERERDVENEAYRRLYNLLADAAFDGGLLTEEGEALRQLDSGEAVCALLSSTEAAGADCTLLAAPAMQGSEAACTATAWGLAVTAWFDTGLDGSAAFIGWLSAPERLIPAALRCALLPAVEGEWPEDAALGALADGVRLSFVAADSDWRQNQAEFEESFRAAMRLLGE